MIVMKNKNKNKDKTTKFVNKSRKKQSNKKLRHFDKKAVKNMIDLCKPEEYEDYSDYYWDKDN